MMTITTTMETWQASSSQLQELLGMDKASNYSATASQGAGYKDEDKYEKEKNVRRYIFFFCEIYSFVFVSCHGFLNDMKTVLDINTIIFPLI